MRPQIRTFDRRDALSLAVMLISTAASIVYWFFFAGQAAYTYNAFPDAYRRIRVAYIDAARKRPEEFEKRMKSFLEKTRQNRRIPGFGGIDKYYEQSSREEGTT